MKSIREGDNPTPDEIELEGAHIFYARTLRSWFIAYGIGGPVLLLSNKELAARFQQSPNAWTIVSAFLVGLGEQLFVALAFKASLWYLAYGERYPSTFKKTLRYKVGLWLTDANWFELLLDIVTCFTFGWATIEVARIFLGP